MFIVAQTPEFHSHKWLRCIYRKGALLLPFVSHGLLSGVSLKPEERNTLTITKQKTQNAQNPQYSMCV